MSNKTEMNAAVEVVFESAGITDFTDQDESGMVKDGTVTVHVRTKIDLSGNIQQIFETLAGLDAEQVNSLATAAVAGTLGELIPELAEGGCYVQS